jgi:hypothetical protein
MIEATLEHPAVLLTSVREIDGLRVGLRLARANDADRIREFLDGLSTESRRRRFGTPVPRVGGALVRHFALPDGRRSFVVLATAPVEQTERVVGIADVVLLRPALAELAFVVADELQGRGVGRSSPRRPLPSRRGAARRPAPACRGRRRRSGRARAHATPRPDRQRLRGRIGDRLHDAGGARRVVGMAGRRARRAARELTLLGRPR